MFILYNLIDRRRFCCNLTERRRKRRSRIHIDSEVELKMRKKRHGCWTSEQLEKMGPKKNDEGLVGQGGIVAYIGRLGVYGKVPENQPCKGLEKANMRSTQTVPRRA